MEAVYGMKKILAVPTNIITGALGSGKTTLILSLIEQKPVDEKWAILVNEFGEVGIDGALLDNPNKNIFVREVPGGCMCCTSGLPMQIALNQLLAEAKPDRLLIEPTGLGHPKEVLETLTAPHYREVLNVQSTLSLIDARNIKDRRWREHPTFREQLEIADTIVLTKSQHYSSVDRQNLSRHIQDIGVEQTSIIDMGNDTMSLTILDALTSSKVSNTQHKCSSKHASHHAHLDEHSSAHAPNDVSPTTSDSIPDVYKVANHGQGYFSFGWICSPERVFDLSTLKSVFSNIDTERLKAVMQTNRGSIGFNLYQGQLDVTEISYTQDSRIEFLSINERQANQIADRIERELNLQNL